MTIDIFVTSLQEGTFSATFLHREGLVVVQLCHQNNEDNYHLRLKKNGDSTCYRITPEEPGVAAGRPHTEGGSSATLRTQSSIGAQQGEIRPKSGRGFEADLDVVEVLPHLEVAAP